MNAQKKEKKTKKHKRSLSDWEKKSHPSMLALQPFLARNPPNKYTEIEMQMIKSNKGHKICNGGRKYQNKIRGSEGGEGVKFMMCDGQ
jgi:hypothetical protein